MGLAFALFNTTSPDPINGDSIMEHELILKLLMLMLGATLLVALCHRLGLSSIVGYLASGLLFGPHLFGVLHESETLHWMAELGVVLLMFTIGLEFSLPKLLAARRLVLGLGGAQVTLLTLLVAGALNLWLDIDWALAVVIGGAFAMSSTAIDLKQLGEQGELQATHGRIATGVLLFQDIAAVPFLVLLPLLGQGVEELPAVLLPTLLKAVGVFALLAITGRYLLPRLLHWVANTHSLELFMLSVLAMALSAASVSVLSGLSATLGAFMAGMMLGETHFRHQIEADIRPFRDLMLGLFFISIGMQLDPQVLTRNPGAIAAVVLTLTVGKALLQWLLIRSFGYPPQGALRAAIVLAQGGEFGLLLVAQALSLQLGDARLLQPVLAGLIISMLLAPLLLRYNAELAGLFGQGKRTLPDDEPMHSGEDIDSLQDHVLIFGYGRLGQGIAHVLNENAIDTLAIDRDARRVRELRAEGESVLYGDASNPRLLELARTREARAAAITFDDIGHSLAVIAQIRRFNRRLPVMLLQPQDQPPLHIDDAQVFVFDAAMESSLMFARQLLLLSGLDSDQADHAANAVRTHDYSELRSVIDAAETDRESR